MAPYTEQEILTALESVPHAGGDEYTESMGKLHPSDADTTVSTLSGLQSALNSSADIIAIDDDIYVGSAMLNVGNKTLVGDRGWNGSDGPMLYTDVSGYVSTPWSSSRPYSMLYSYGSPRITGLRIRGSHYQANGSEGGFYEYGNNHDSRMSRGIYLRGNGKNAEIDNCEIYGFAWSGIYMYDKQDLEYTEAEIHHNFIHRNLQDGYGYGVDHSRAWSVMHHNFFNWQRHAIDGFGWANSGYECYENIIGPDHLSHTIDMHCLTENSQGSSDDPEHPEYYLRAGGQMTIRDNTICHDDTTVTGGQTLKGIVIRGYPHDGCDIERNRFVYDSPPSENPSYPSNSPTPATWHQRNLTWSGTDNHPPVDSEGYTLNWNYSGNQYDIPATPHDGSAGASVDLENPGSTVDSDDWYNFPRERFEEVDRVISERP